jgi:D-alanine-D-alanine ligase
VNTLGKTAVLYGGDSAEREVSLASGQAVLNALCGAGVDAFGFDPAQQPLSRLIDLRVDRVFIALHGQHGEDGSVQGALDCFGLPYTGSGVLACALAMDKWRSKLVWRGLGLPTPDAQLIDHHSDFAAIATQLGLPLFVKPAAEGSSIGISKVHAVSDFAQATALAARTGNAVIAEQFMAGGEYTVSLLGTHALPVIRIVPAGEYYDYAAKYDRDDTQYQIPCGLSSLDERSLQDLALRAAQALGCRGWCRIDIMRDGQGKPFILEANTAPGMTAHSLVPMAAKAVGMDFQTLVLRVLEAADHD